MASMAQREPAGKDSCSWDSDVRCRATHRRWPFGDQEVSGGCLGLPTGFSLGASWASMDGALGGQRRTPFGGTMRTRRFAVMATTLAVVGCRHRGGPAAARRSHDRVPADTQLRLLGHGRVEHGGAPPRWRGVRRRFLRRRGPRRVVRPTKQHGGVRRGDRSAPSLQRHDQRPGRDAGHRWHLPVPRRHLHHGHWHRPQEPGQGQPGQRSERLRWWSVGRRLQPCAEQHRL